MKLWSASTLASGISSAPEFFRANQKVVWNRRLGCALILLRALFFRD